MKRPAGLTFVAVVAIILGLAQIVARSDTSTLPHSSP